MGPLTISPNNASLVNNTKTASTFANLLFIDFLGNGFSFAADVK